MKKVVTSVVAGILIGAMTSSAQAHCGMCPGDPSPAKKEVKESVEKDSEQMELQTTCPVMGGKISKSLYVDHDGKRIYVCCKGCVGKVKKDPAKYIEKMESEGVTLNKIQTSCPVMGAKINKELYVDHDGKRVYFCCRMCPKKFKQDPEKFVKKLESAGITLVKVQTKCPVMGGNIDRNLYVDYIGKRIYVCCKGCIDKVKADPGKYVKKLEEAGLTLDAAAKTTEDKEGSGNHRHH